MNIGIIGTGWVAGLHLDALKQIEEARVVAIAGRNQARAHELAEPLGANTYSEPLAMLQAESLDAVFILLPPHLHGDLEKMCSEHVKGVLIEKPISQSLDTAHAVNRAFKEAGTIVSVGYMNRYRQSVQRIRDLFSQSENQGILAHGWWTTQMPPPLWWRTFDQSGGQFVEQCTHLVDICRYVMGDIVEVSAYSTNGYMTEVPDFSVDDAMVVNARFTSGALATFSTGCFPLGGHPESAGGGIGLQLSSRHHRITLSGWNFEGIVHSEEETREPIPVDENIFYVQNQAFLNAVATNDPSGILSSYEDGRTISLDARHSDPLLFVPMGSLSKIPALFGFALLGISVLLPSHSNGETAAHWPQFLGPDGLADAGDQDIPLAFGPGQHEHWRIETPKGNSSPIVWGDTLFLAGYEGEERLMQAYNRQDGSLIWERCVPAQSPEEFIHRLAGPAASTPCTDGNRVYFYFGNYGLVALNLDGSLAWEKQLSKPRSGMGTGTSPILFDDSLILVRDGTDDPCVLSLDRVTGEVRWKHPRIGYRISHASPFSWKNRLQTELVIAGTSSLVSLNPETGRLIWKVEDTNGFPCTTPTGTSERLFFASWSANSSGGRDTLEAHFDDELVFSDAELDDPDLFFERFDRNNDGVIAREELPPSRARDVFKWLDRNGNTLWEPEEFDILLRPPGKGRNIMVTVDPGGEGLLNGTGFVAWEHRKNLPYVATPLVSGNRVYLVKSLGIVSCLNTETGTPFYDPARTGVKGEYFASPLKIGDKILIISSLGTLFLIRDDPSFEIVSRNTIGEEIIATPAIVDNTIYVRSRERLWAFKQKPKGGHSE